MAVLSKIRERSLFLIIIIALALFSFVLSGLFDGNLFNKNITEIGEVNGESISREEFAQQVDFYRNRSNGRGINSQFVNNAWNSLVSEKIYETQLEKSGIVVGEKDIWDALVSQVSQQNSPQFLNEVGLFDQEKLKEYIATLQENAEGDEEQGKAAWLGWLNYERNIKKGLEQNTYNALVKAGLGSTLAEGKNNYFFQNINVDLDYVYVPFSNIADTLISVSSDDIKSYVKKHAKDFKVKESRNIQYINFLMQATDEDEEIIKNELSALINDRDEYSNAAKTTINVVGFKNATDIVEFNAENESDNTFDDKYYTKNNLSKIVSESLFDKEINEVFGPYKENNSYKISKISAVKQLPDSVKASHILISFIGSSTADASVTKNEEEARKVADSILTLVKTNKSKFEEIAKEVSIDKGSGAKGGDLGWFTYNRMVPVFRDYVFENKVGDIDIVKSQFGFHIIKIEGQKNNQKYIQVATFSKKIEASEKTENDVFEKAETFASELSADKDIDDLAKENDYKVIPVSNLEVFDDNIAQLGSQRQIVRWIFEESTNVNDIKRFDTDKGYIVVVLSKKNKAGLSVRGKDVRSIILNEKKAELIKNRSTGETLDEIAKQNETVKQSSLAISNASPVFAGQGRFTDIAGVVTSLNENELTKNILGKTGVVFAKITKKTLPIDLDNYNSYKRGIEKTVQGRSLQIFNAIKENSEIVDNRAYFY
ncbi:MAG: peptidylprolyl isomerase [Flavobacteriaceae bacterium]|nr:peptidylprolyl isomerase [Flavobacteriaceae bacterium]